MKLSAQFEPAVDHNAALIEELRADPAYARIYLQTALDEIQEEGGAHAFIMAFRCFIKAGYFVDK